MNKKSTGAISYLQNFKKKSQSDKEINLAINSFRNDKDPTIYRDYIKKYTIVQFRSNCESKNKPISSPSRPHQNKKDKKKQQDIKSKNVVENVIKEQVAKEVKKEKQYFQNEYQDNQYSKFFNANILQDQEYQQQFLYNIITKYCGKIRSTKLIYIWSPLHKSNIHEYIDNKGKLLFLAKTEEESILAAYTEMPFKKPFPDVGFGALISLTNRKVFPVKKNQRAISYDGTYVAFGNYELLIKGNQISSNLGNAGGYYESNGEKARILFNEGTKSATKIAELQVFQIFT